MGRPQLLLGSLGLIEAALGAGMYASDKGQPAVGMASVAVGVCLIASFVIPRMRRGIRMVRRVMLIDAVVMALLAAAAVALHAIPFGLFLLSIAALAFGFERYLLSYDQHDRWRRLMSNYGTD